MLRTSLIIIVAVFIYLLSWPVAINPQSWDAPTDAGLTGDFAPNNVLDNVEIIELGDTHGPEGLALIDGEVYMATREGWILRLNESTGELTKWVNTEGSPLGLAVDANNNLLIADAYKGILQVTPEGELSVLTNSIDGVPIVLCR